MTWFKDRKINKKNKRIRNTNQSRSGSHLTYDDGNSTNQNGRVYFFIKEEGTISYPCEGSAIGIPTSEHWEGGRRVLEHTNGEVELQA